MKWLKVSFFSFVSIFFTLFNIGSVLSPVMFVLVKHTDKDVTWGKIFVCISGIALFFAVTGTAVELRLFATKWKNRQWVRLEELQSMYKETLPGIMHWIMLCVFWTLACESGKWFKKKIGLSE